MNTDRTTLRVTILLCVGVAALVVGSAARGNASGATDDALVVKLKAKRGSGVTGTGRLVAAGDDMRVVLRLNKRVRGSLPAHIHTGPCRREPTFANPRIHNSLNDVVKGKSVTTVAGLTLATLRAATFSINVHDPASLMPIACGDIPRAS